VVTRFNTARHQQASAIGLPRSRPSLREVGVAGTVYNIATLTFMRALTRNTQGS